MQSGMRSTQSLPPRSSFTANTYMALERSLDAVARQVRCWALLYRLKGPLHVDKFHNQSFLCQGVDAVQVLTFCGCAFHNLHINVTLCIVQRCLAYILFGVCGLA